MIGPMTQVFTVWRQTFTLPQLCRSEWTLRHGRFAPSAL